MTNGVPDTALAATVSAAPAAARTWFTAMTDEEKNSAGKPPAPFWYWDKGDLAIVGDGIRSGTGDFEIGEVGLLTRVPPETDGAVESVTFEAIDNEAGVGRVVDVKACLSTVYVDLDVRPLLGLELGPGFVDRGPLTAKLFPGKTWDGDVLHGVIAHGLIFGMRVAGA